MNYNIIDSGDIKVNDNLEITEITLGDDYKHTILIIDNFLENPEDLLSIIEQHPIELEWGKWGHPLNLKLPFIKMIFHHLGMKYFGMPEDAVKDPKDIQLQLNLVNGGMPCNYTTIVPHIDPAMLAFSLYLNKDEDCKGGTAFFQHIPSGIDYQIGYFEEPFRKTEKYWQIHETYRKAHKHNYEIEMDTRQLTDDWAIEYEVEMKFNRFVMHPSYIFHTAYIEKEWFQEEKRVSLAGFIQ